MSEILAPVPVARLHARFGRTRRTEADPSHDRDWHLFRPIRAVGATTFRPSCKLVFTERARIQFGDPALLGGHVCELCARIHAEMQVVPPVVK